MLVVHVFFQQLAKGMTLMLDRVSFEGVDQFLGGLAQRFAWGRHYIPIENAC